ncbi:MAG: alpha/beta hydrolase-fold protein [Gemmatimonadota bacterium]
MSAGPDLTLPWVEADQSPAGPAAHRVFQSRLLGAPVSYRVYLPPGAGREPLPVIYWLHGLGGSPRQGEPFARRLDGAVRAGAIQPTMAVFANGLPFSWYCDAADGSAPVEAVLIGELIPHVDATYPTVADRRGRAVEGFSMGGFGAARLAWKHPELFAACSLAAAALYDGEAMAGGGRSWEWGLGPLRRRELFDRVFGGDAGYFEACSPWTWLRRGALELRVTQALRLVVGADDPLTACNRRCRALLQELGVPHSYAEVPGAAHRLAPLYACLGEEAVGFFGRALGG